MQHFSLFFSSSFPFWESHSTSRWTTREPQKKPGRIAILFSLVLSTLGVLLAFSLLSSDSQLLKSIACRTARLKKGTGGAFLRGFRARSGATTTSVSGMNMPPDASLSAIRCSSCCFSSCHSELDVSGSVVSSPFPCIVDEFRHSEGFWFHSDRRVNSRFFVSSVLVSFYEVSVCFLVLPS
jgi:hypothetical protein